jgi:hypothetical protein
MVFSDHRQCSPAVEVVRVMLDSGVLRHIGLPDVTPLDISELARVKQ